MKRAQRLWVALIMGITTALAAPVAASANDTNAIDYVAIGDSFGSGAGAGNYAKAADANINFWKGGDCLQSRNGFSPLLATAIGANLDFQSCSGAVTADVRSSQMATLSSSTDLITISIGGNDVGFADVLKTCTFNGTATCTSRLEDAENQARNVLSGRLASLYSEIRDRAPNAQVMVLGYPQLFAGKTCFGNTGINKDEQARINQANYVLNGVIETASRNAGFTYIDTMPPFVGKGVCASGSWINGLKLNFPESYHPNAAGHRDGYLPLLLNRVNQLDFAAA